MRSVSLAILSALFALPALAQQPQQPAGGATIVGNITCGDSNTPGRLARILLKPATIDDSVVDARLQTRLQAQENAAAQARTRNPNSTTPTPRPPSPQQQAAMRQGIVQQVSLQSEASNSTTADFTGHYTLTGVPPDTYYVHVQMPGYVDALDQFSLDQLTSPDPETARRIAQFVPRITILGTEEQRVDLRIERGAAISGRILYDDGSPAPGWQIMALPLNPSTGKVGFPTSGANIGSSLTLNSPPARTDDLGNFRLTGLAAGPYAVRASLAVASPGARGMPTGVGVNMTVYSGDTFHMAEAQTFSLSAGQNRSGTDIIVPLNKVHSIHGSVVAKSDGHGPSSGSLSLSAKDDPNFRPYTTLLPDGSFTFYSIPAGEYTLTINGAADTHPVTMTIPNGTRTTTVRSRSYGSAQTTVIVNDVDLIGITLTVPDAGERAAPATN